MLSRLLLEFRRRRYRKRNPMELLGELASDPTSFRVLIHAGAHLAQERRKYEALGYRDILWIEGSPLVYERLVESLRDDPGDGSCRHRTCSALLADSEGGSAELRQVSNDGMSSSIFPLAERGRERWHVHETGVREEAVTRTLDGVAAEFGLLDTADTLVVDVQGAELLVLKGAERLLRRVRAIVTEVSTRPYYEGGVLFPELRDFLRARGFVAMSTPRRHGDMLFLRGGR